MEKTLKTLLPPGQEIITVKGSDALAHALELMREHDFNQLPIVTADHRCLGEVVTIRSVLDAADLFNAAPEKLRVSQAMVKVETFRSDEDLLEALDDIQEEGFAIIVDGDRRLIGIVTTADTTEHLRRYSEDIMLVAFAERSLKAAIQSLYDGQPDLLQDAIARVCDRSGDARQRFTVAALEFFGRSQIQVDAKAFKEAFTKVKLSEGPKPFEMLSFEEFSQLLLSHERAPKLEGANEVTEVRTMLSRIRDVRNKLAHFRGELSETERRYLRRAEKWLEQYVASLAPEPAGTTNLVPVKPPINLPAEVRPPVEEGEKASMYSPFGQHLATRPMSERTIRFSFEEIAKLVGKHLPKSAYEYRAWWSNDPERPHAAEWLNAGWRAQSVSMGEERVDFVRIREREDAYIRFFSEVKKRLQNQPSFPLHGLSPQGQGWHVFAELPWKSKGCAMINGSFARSKRVRAEIYIDCGDKEANKERFTKLQHEWESFEAQFGEPLEWEQMADRTASRVAVYTDGHITVDEGSLNSLADWMTDRVLRFYRVFLPFFQQNP